MPRLPQRALRAHSQVLGDPWHIFDKRFLPMLKGPLGTLIVCHFFGIKYFHTPWPREEPKLTPTACGVNEQGITYKNLTPPLGVPAS